MLDKKIILIGGGTISHVRNHLALCAPAYGHTVRKLGDIIREEKGYDNYHIIEYFTNMAGGKDGLETNHDIELLVDKLVHDPLVKIIIFNPALVDFDGSIDNVPSGKYAERLQTKNGNLTMQLTPTDKIIGKIRKTRKDIFVVGFKTTTNASSDEQYIKGLELLKKNSLNLVLANDTVTRNNMIIVPEEARYYETPARDSALYNLVTIMLSRAKNTFTRSTVLAGFPVQWHSDEIPDNLTKVVDYCIASGAYKPFLGRTAGHFATKVNDHEILTTIRKTNFNELHKHGLVRVEYDEGDKVIAYGAKPSVGGMSQRIIFSEHPDAECIVHFHCPPNSGYSKELSVRPQIFNECGSHQCGQNTSDGLAKVDLGDGDYLKVVYLDNHGPNIVFSKKTPPDKIINYIENTFDLFAKTGGLV